MFAKESIPQGVLIVASKALVSVFEDEVGNSDSSSDVGRNDLLERSLAGAVRRMVNEECHGHPVLKMAGGPLRDQEVDIELLGIFF